MDMIDQIVEPDFLIALLVACCVGATLLTLSATLFPADTLSIRMKSVASERQRLKAQGMEEKKTNTRQLRYQQQRLIKDIVEKFSLSQWLYAEDAKARLASAGFRGPQAESTFLFSRLLSPLVFSCCAVVYTSVLHHPICRLASNP